ncbi:MAG: hypothetical protein ACJ75H_24805 [Thermoanaerobaculia bacterium]
MSARKLQPALLLLPLLFAACGDAGPAFRAIPLSGSPADIRGVQGRWYDFEGNLIAVITGGKEPTLTAHLPKDLAPRSASVQGQDLLLRLPSAPDCRCQLSRVNPVNLGFVRDPPALWVAERRAAKTLRLCPEAFARAQDSALDWLGRRL